MKRPGRRVLVWVDSRRAVIVDGPTSVAIVGSDVPAHHRSTGHVRHDPAVRHGGGGPSQTAADARLLEHRRQFLDRVLRRLATATTVDVVGPGELPGDLVQRIRAADRDTTTRRQLTVHRAGRSTPRQLVATWRSLGGLPLRRVTRGSWRWQGRLAEPWRLWPKPRRMRSHRATDLEVPEE